MAKSLKLEDIYLISRKITPVSEAEVQALEANLGCKLPGHYAEIMTQFGPGTFSNRVSLYAPEQILGSAEKHRAKLAQKSSSYFAGQLTSGDLTKMVFVGTTSEKPIGFLPGREEVLYVFDLEMEEHPSDLLELFGNWSKSDQLAFYEPDRDCAEVIMDGPRAFSSFDEATGFFRDHFTIDQVEQQNQMTIIMYSQELGAIFLYFNNVLDDPDNCTIELIFDTDQAPRVLPVAAVLSEKGLGVSDLEGITKEEVQKYSAVE